MQLKSTGSALFQVFLQHHVPRILGKKHQSSGSSLISACMSTLLEEFLWAPLTFVYLCLYSITSPNLTLSTGSSTVLWLGLSRGIGLGSITWLQWRDTLRLLRKSSRGIWLPQTNSEIAQKDFWKPLAESLDIILYLFILLNAIMCFAIYLPTSFEYKKKSFKMCSFLF